MSALHSTRLCTASIWLICLLSAGCVVGPDWLSIASLSPITRRAWEEDEQFGPTFYAKRDELRAVRDAIPSMTAAEQNQLAFQLSEVLRNEENNLLRREAVLTMGFLSTPNCLPSLRRAQSDPDSDVRAAACRAWGQRGGEEAVRALAEIVGSDQDVDVRMLAIDQLGRFRGPVVQQALAVALDDADPALQYQAVESLQGMGEVDYGNSVYAWREYLRGNNPPVPPGPSLVERFRSWF